MPTRTPSRKATESGALKRLGQAEEAKLLSLLLKAHPELRAEAESLALEMITTVDLEAVADEVAWAFEGIDQDRIWERSGPDPLGGYTDPGEAADEICEETFEPFLKELKRLLDMGQMEPALAQVKGLLLGLSRLRDELPEDAREYPSESGAFAVLQTWAKTAPTGSEPGLVEWMHQELPGDWGSHMERVWRDLRHRAGKSR